MRVVEGGGARRALRQIVSRRHRTAAGVDRIVRPIIAGVKRQGDAALRRYAVRFGELSAAQPLTVRPNELRKALKNCSPTFRAALTSAERNIRRFAEQQKPKQWQKAMLPGGMVGQFVRPLDSAGCYVPGGRYPLPSTLLMTVIPAQVAGVNRIVVASPRPTTETLAAAALLGIDEFYCVGGAHAIAALAYGTRTIPPVDKIVGPGNRYVTAAKKLVGFDCAIDMLAGPTEALIFCERGKPAFIAADLVAQAEHDIDALPIFVTTRTALAVSVEREVHALAKSNATARHALRRNGVIFRAASRSEAFDIINRIAPEHLTIDTRRDIDFVRNAGSVFIGDYSTQALGDYCAGPNHVLPTNGSARFRGGLSVLDFVKIITVQKFSRAGVRRIADVATILAEAEGLRAHAAAVRIRCGNRGDQHA